MHGRRGEWALAEAHLRTALGATPPACTREARAGWHAELSLTLHERGDAPGAREHARLARELAEDGDDAVLVARALNILGVLRAATGTSTRRAATSSRAWPSPPGWGTRRRRRPR